MVWGVLTNGIISQVGSIEPVAASDHKKVFDEAPVQPSLKSNDHVECHPSLLF